MKKILCVSLATVWVSACSTTPPPQPAQNAAQRPVPQAPQPVAPRAQAPVIQENLPMAGNDFMAPVPGSADDFVYQTGGDARIYFGYDQYDLSPQAREVLRAQAEWLIRYPQVQAVIEGNADERGTREYNLALGARRADSTKSFLVTQGVAPNRLTTVSYGKERPIDGGSSPDAWARNRNAHTNLLTGSIG